VNALFSDALAATHVLIVDDDAQEQYVLQEMLQGNGFRFSHVDTYLSAVGVALSDRPDIILVSLRSNSPDIAELETLLRGNPATQTVPLLILATAKRLGDGVTVERSEVLDFLIRPFTVGQLVDRVQAQLRMAVLLREQGAAIGENDAPAPREEWELIGRAKKLLAERLAQVHRLADLAEVMSVPERRLVLAFQHCLGISAVEFIRQERIRKAKFLLTNTTLSVREIAITVGFSSAANFSTAFNTQVGTSPSSFRNQALSNALVLDRGVNLKQR